MYTLWEETLQLSKEMEEDWNLLALKIFKYQYENVIIYRDFIQTAGYSVENIQHFSEIPFLPISFFKTHRVCTEGSTDGLLYFESSGTTGMETSKHYVLEPKIYQESFLNTFKTFYGDPQQYIFVCLLPSYLERGHSSLVYMCQHLIDLSQHPDSNFYLYDFEALAQLLQTDPEGRKFFLIGVSFALLDFAKAFPMALNNSIVMETGGMKGRKAEWTKGQIHDYLQQQFQLKTVHSEYGMTELLSQAYAVRDGIFETPPYMKLLVREIQDPKRVHLSGNGLANVIDLANIHSCSFIATDDIAEVYPDGRFQILGRKDHSVLRGCSLLVV